MLRKIAQNVNAIVEKIKFPKILDEFNCCEDVNKKNQIINDICINHPKSYVLFVLKICLQNRYDLTFTDKNGNMPIHYICMRKDFTPLLLNIVLDTYTKLNIDIHNCFNLHGMNIFEIICRNCDNECILIILEYYDKHNLDVTKTVAPSKHFVNYNVSEIMFENIRHLDIDMMKYIFKKYKLSTNNVQLHMIRYLKKLKNEKKQLTDNQKKVIKYIIIHRCTLDNHIEKNKKHNHTILKYVIDNNDDDLIHFILDYYIQNKIYIDLKQEPDEYKLVHFVALYGTIDLVLKMLKSDIPIASTFVCKKKYVVNGRNVIRKCEMSSIDLVRQNKNLCDNDIIKKYL